MRNRSCKVLIVAAAATIAAGVSVAAPAGANTSAYFTITGGALSVSAPAPGGGVNLGSISSTNVLAGGSVTVAGQLGNVTVTDTRGSLVAAWTATVSATDFVHTAAGGTPAENEKVPKANIAYMATNLGQTLTGTTRTGVGTFVPGLAPSLATSSTAGVWSGSGSNSVVWNPTLTLSLTQSQVAGRYDGVITHSVA